jgi:hypothetical protein
MLMVIVYVVIGYGVCGMSKKWKFLKLNVDFIKKECNNLDFLCFLMEIEKICGTKNFG